MIRALAACVLVCAVLAALALGTARGRDMLREARHAVRLALAARATDRTEVFVEARGARLATDVYLPRGAEGPLPALLLRLPYGKRRFAEVPWWLRLFGPDHAVVVQDMRGRGRSTGAFEPWRHEGADGAATLDWIAAQPWSSGRVGTAGCSALGEAQLPLAALNHPAHAAMIPIGAGGGVGDLAGRRAPFGIWEGGVPMLAAGAGWFASDAGIAPDLGALPLTEAVPGSAGWREMLRGLEPGWAARMGYLTEESRPAVPALVVDGWYDPNVAASLSLVRAMRAAGAEASALILPALHCDLTGGLREGRVGDVAVGGAVPDLGDLFRRFMAGHLSGEPEPRPPYEVWAMGADAWIVAEAWPPSDRPVRLHLNGEALARAPGGAPRSFVSDPADPVPSLGGAICCVEGVSAGPREQSAIEGRGDLLTWTSAPMDRLIAGAPEVTLALRVEAPDADIVARLTEVRPDGTSITITEGALRLRYRGGFDAPAPVPDGPFEVTVRLAPIAWRMADGARLGLHVAASSFPRLARNMQGGGDPLREEAPRAARITVIEGRVTLP